MARKCPHHMCSCGCLTCNRTVIQLFVSCTMRFKSNIQHLILNIVYIIAPMSLNSIKALPRVDLPLLWLLIIALPRCLPVWNNCIVEIQVGLCCKQLVWPSGRIPLDVERIQTRLTERDRSRSRDILHYYVFYLNSRSHTLRPTPVLLLVIFWVPGYPGTR